MTQPLTPEMTPQALLEVGQQVLSAQAFSQYMGLELRHFARGEVEMFLALRPAFRQHQQYIHGGVSSFVVDTTLAFAGSTHLGPHIVTGNFHIDYLRPAKGVGLRSVGTVVSSGKRQAVCRCEVYDQDDTGQETLCVAAQGTIVKLG